MIDFRVLVSPRRERSGSLPGLAWALVSALAGSAALQAQDAVKLAAPPSPSPAQPERTETQVPVRFQGLLPGNVNRQLDGKFQVEFRIYPSPQGGQPIWRETREVEVKNGEIDVELGARTPIPMEIHEATYKWLGAAVNGQREIFPRYPIVNVVYASPHEAVLAHERWRAEAPRERRTQEYEPAARARTMAAERGEEVTWREALDSARSKGGELADYQDWYRTLETLPPEASASWSGHYEWVLPWVYDTASHGRYNTLFRGRFQGCDYSDLSPQKKYPFRVAMPVPAPAAINNSPAKEAQSK